MKRLLMLGVAALSLIGISFVGGGSPARADTGCTIAIHLNVNVNGTGQGQDLCIPEGLGVPSVP